MILRLKYYRFCLRVVTYLLPFLAFECGLADMDACMGRSAAPSAIRFLRTLQDIGSCCIRLGHSGRTLWGDKCGRTIPRAYRDARRLVCECGDERCTAWRALFLSQDFIFPRGLFAVWALMLLFLTVLMRTCFRIYVRLKISEGRPVRLLIVGADHFAHKTVVRLQEMPLGPCEVAGFVRLPGQQAAFTNKPVHELDSLGVLDVEQGFDEAVIAVDPAEFHEIPKILKGAGTFENSNSGHRGLGRRNRCPGKTVSAGSHANAGPDHHARRIAGL